MADLVLFMMHCNVLYLEGDDENGKYFYEIPKRKKQSIDIKL